MLLSEFRSIYKMLDITDSQKRAISDVIYQIDKGIKNELIKTDKKDIYVTSINEFSHCGLTLTIHSESKKDTGFLCLTDKQLFIKIGKRGKLTIEDSKESKTIYTLQHL